MNNATEKISAKNAYYDTKKKRIKVPVPSKHSTLIWCWYMLK